MAQVPVFNQSSVTENPTPIPYKSANVNEATFNSNMGLDDVGRGMIYDSKAMQEARDAHNKTLVMEKSNEFDATVLKTLTDKENGLYTKSGKAYLDAVEPTMQSLNKAKEELVSGLDADQQQLAMSVLNSKMANINEDVMKNSVKQNQVYREQTLSNLINTQTQMAIVNRNNAGAVKTNIANVNASIDATYGNSVDTETLKGMKQKATSDMLISVLEGRITDKSLYAKDFFDMFQSQIDPTKHAKLLDEINTMDSDVRSRLFADNCYKSGLDEQKAYNQALELDKKNGTNDYTSKVSAIYGHEREMKNQAYDNQVDNFWNTYADNPDINNIPTWMKGKDRIVAQNYAETYANKATKGKHDPDAYVHLYEMSTTNADAFVKMNLNQYRDVLTNDEYKSFAKRQQDIIAHGYSSITPDDKATKKVIKSILGTYGNLNVPNKQNVATIMQNIINEKERRTGQKLSAEELKTEEQKIAGWLGHSSNASSIKVINDNATKAGFYKGLANDMTYFEKVHKRPPDQKEFQSILYQRANHTIQDRNQSVYDNARGANKNGSYFEGHKITSSFGPRQRPVAGASSNHKGVDLAFYKNEPIKAFVPGVVVNTGHSPTLGNYVEIKGNDGAMYEYGHANSINVKKGARVNQNTVIALAGSTGVATGPHLHFAKIVNGKFVDPVGSINTNMTVAHNKPSNNIVVGQGQRIMRDANGNRALVAVDSNGNPTKVIREL